MKGRRSLRWQLRVEGPWYAPPRSQAAQEGVQPQQQPQEARVQFI
eukprot:gene4533-9834_t